MGRLVMKFGGTSVANIDRIRNVAQHVKREVDAGHEVAVVVSAMSGKTNELVAWCTEASPMHDAREYDAVVASGEQVTSGLLAIVLQGIGIQDYNMDETISTLRFASRAKQIQNKPTVNEDPKDTIMREYQEQIEQYGSGCFRH